MRISRITWIWVILLLLFVSVAPAESRRGPFVEQPRSVRSRTFDQQHIRLDLKFDFQQREVAGRAMLRLCPIVPLTTVELDAADMKIEQVALADEAGNPTEQKLTFASQDRQLTITLDRSYKADETIRLAIDYRLIKPQRGVHFVASNDDTDRAAMAWTHGEPITARYWFPSFDSPADRLTSEILVTVPDGFFVLANGSLKSKTPNADGTRTWHWTQEQPHVTYLMSVVAGQFEAFEQQWDGIPVVSYVPKGRLADAARSFEKTPRMVEFFSQKIGYRYPWPKYTQICVGEYLWGGMEHTSATTLNLNTLHDERAHLDVSSDGLVAHELAHQWWGDLITCKDWGELWLNESFATYFTTVWTEHDLGPEEASWRRYQEAESYFGEDKDEYRRPIVTYRYRQPWNMFDSHSYPKGGRVLHMLRFVLGEELFWKAIRHYCHKHAFNSVETADFRIAIEEATGQGLNWFFDQWLYHGGHPQYEVAYNWDQQQKSLELTVKQVQKVDALTPLFRMPVEIELFVGEETLIKRITVSQKEEKFHFSLDQRPSRVCFDPHDWILKKLDFKKSKEEWLTQAAAGQVICRVRAVQELAQFTKDPDVLTALAKVAREDTFWGVRQEAAKAIGAFTDNVARDALLQTAREDPKAQVRREAIKALEKHSGKETVEALRQIIAEDQSYYAVAEALRTLVKVDRAGCRADLQSAMARESHAEVILAAAADGFAELGDRQAGQDMAVLLKQATSPARQKALFKALVRLSKDQPELLEAVREQLDAGGYKVRLAAIEALGEAHDPQVIEWLVARRPEEPDGRLTERIDKSLEKLRKRQQDLQKIQQRLDTVEKENRTLRARLEALETAAETKQ